MNQWSNTHNELPVRICSFRTLAPLDAAPRFMGGSAQGQQLHQTLWLRKLPWPCRALALGRLGGVFRFDGPFPECFGAASPRPSRWESQDRCKWSRFKFGSMPIGMATNGQVRQGDIRPGKPGTGTRRWFSSPRCGRHFSLVRRFRWWSAASGSQFQRSERDSQGYCRLRSIQLEARVESDYILRPPQRSHVPAIRRFRMVMLNRVPKRSAGTSETSGPQIEVAWLGPSTSGKWPVIPFDRFWLVVICCLLTLFNSQDQLMPRNYRAPAAWRAWSSFGVSESVRNMMTHDDSISSAGGIHRYCRKNSRSMCNRQWIMQWISWYISSPSFEVL